MPGKAAGGKGEPMQRRRVALRAVNGENLSVSKLNQQTPKTGRVALSNLTNTVAQRTPKSTHVELVKPSGPLPKSATKTAKPALSATKRRVPDIEQPYPKRVLPIFEEVPRLPHNWAAGGLDIWTVPPPSEDSFDEFAKLNISFEPMPLAPTLPDLDAVPLLDDDFSADLHRDLSDDAKQLAAELLGMIDSRP